jgi:surface protein
MVYDETYFNQDIGSWDVGNVISISHMFYRVKSFNQDISYWDVRNITNMYVVFCTIIF